MYIKKASAVRSRISSTNHLCKLRMILRWCSRSRSVCDGNQKWCFLFALPTHTFQQQAVCRPRARRQAFPCATARTATLCGKHRTTLFLSPAPALCSQGFLPSRVMAPFSVGYLTVLRLPPRAPLVTHTAAARAQASPAAVLKCLRLVVDCVCCFWPFS